MVYVHIEEGDFDGFLSKIDYIVKTIKDDKVQEFRWFQEKASYIKDKTLFDYAILSIDRSFIIIAALIDFIFETISGEEKKISVLFSYYCEKECF